MSTSPRRLLPLLLLLLTSWLALITAEDTRDPSDLPADDTWLTDAINVNELHYDLNSPLSDSVPRNFPDAKDDGDKAVASARILLSRIQAPKKGMVQLPKNKGFWGATIHYAKQVFTLLFLNGPPTSEPVTQTTPKLDRKVSGTLQNAVSLLEYAANKYQKLDAFYLLAEMNFHGNYTYPRNYTAAFNYYHALAGISGNSSAQHMLGFIYATGIGGAVEPDQARALLWHTFAAEQGDTRSQMTVAYRHHAGIGTPRNCDMAVKYYRQAAAKAVAYYKSGPPGGHVLVRNAYRLADEEGGVYGEGASVSSAGVNAKQGGPTSDAYADIADVLEYLDFQARKGDLRASFNLAKLYYDGARGMELDLPRAKEEFMRIARMYWLPSGKTVSEATAIVEKLAPRAAGYLGRMFLRGEGTKQSYEIAQIWLKRGVEYGDALSQYSLGVMYMQGLGVPRDAIRAASYLGAAADSDMAVAQTDLGVLFLDQGDIVTARSYFELAVRSGHVEAYYYLAELANQGLGRDRSCNVAAAFYKIAAEKAEIVSASFIEANEAYEAGDLPRATVAYMMAAEQGYENAQANVAWILDRSSPKWSIPNLVSRIVPRIGPATVDSSSVSSDAHLALIYYTRSARQQNLDSLLKAGDAHLSGQGTAPSPENAAACYTAAAESQRSAQAMWNLGWMHELGLGVEKDFHLAKRYYDLALETNKEAYLPVKLSLLVLRVRSWWNDVRGGSVRGIQDERKEKRTRGFWEWVGEFLDNERKMWEEEEAGEAGRDDWFGEVGLDGHGQDQGQGQGQLERERGQGGIGEGEFFRDPGTEGLVESAGILVLAGLLAGLIWWRQQRIRRGNERRDAEGREGLGLAQGQDRGQAGDAEVAQEQRQIFPAPDDPDFAPWAAPGGVGH
ncbi:Protein sel-1 1 [Sphaceloma murrayae]|uniref:Protein sel-1 1 n=1 Tax=Sphaceloma murrayae TaxID=2082308 RepID=A0A2K1QQQ6_9PEZI|nr:Protein sel-1 1 [Sphaceloma murrayae]